MARRALPIATTAQRQALTNMPDGEVVYDTDKERFFTWSARLEAWIDQVTGLAEASVPALPSGATASWEMNELSGSETDTIEGIVLTDTNTVAGDGEKRSFLRANSEYLSNTTLTTAEEDAILPKLSSWSTSFRVSGLVPDPVESQSRIFEIDDTVKLPISLTLLGSGTDSGKLQAVVNDNKSTNPFIIAKSTTSPTECVVTVVIDRSLDELRLYVDKTLEATEDITGLGTLDATIGTYMGVNSAISTSRFLTGDIWQATIWAGKALSLAEIEDVVDNFNGTATGGGTTPTSGEGDSLHNGLVAFWPLDGVSGTRNSEFGDFPLTDNNTVTWAEGKTRARAAQFSDASSEYLSNSIGQAGLFPSTGFHLSVWFYVDASTADQQWLVSKWNASGDQREFLLYIDPADDQIKAIGYATGTSVSAVSVSGGSFTFGAWHLVDVFYDGTDISISVDNAAPTSSALAGVFDSTSNLELSTTGSGIDGRLQDLALWNRPLTDSERTLRYNNGLGFTYPFRYKPTA